MRYLDRSVPFLLMITFCMRHQCSNARIIRETKLINLEPVRYSYDDSSRSQCDTVILINAGSWAYLVEGYDTLAGYIVEDSSVVVISNDHSPVNQYQPNERDFARLCDAIVKDITKIVPACKRQPSIGYIVGGHSAGGTAAIEANIQNLFKRFRPIGMLGIDASPIAAIGTRAPPGLELPSLHWGFTKTSCYVVPPYTSAWAAYRDSPIFARALYLADNSHDPFGLGHCLFYDFGCLPGCSSPKKYDRVIKAFADTVHLFIYAIVHECFDQEAFSTRQGDSDAETYFTLYVGEASPYLPFTANSMVNSTLPPILEANSTLSPLPVNATR